MLNIGNDLWFPPVTGTGSATPELTMTGDATGVTFTSQYAGRLHVAWYPDATPLQSDTDVELGNGRTAGTNAMDLGIITAMGTLPDVELDTTGLTESADYELMAVVDKNDDGGTSGYTIVATLPITAPSDLTAPLISSSDPDDDDLDHPLADDMTYTFDENVQFGTGNIVLRDNDGGWADLETFDVELDVGTGAGQVSISGAVLTVNPTDDLVDGREYAIRIDATAIEDTAGNPFAGIADDTTRSFTASVGETLIADDAFTDSNTTDLATRAATTLGGNWDEVFDGGTTAAFDINSNALRFPGSGSYALYALDDASAVDTRITADLSWGSFTGVDAAGFVTRATGSAGTFSGYFVRIAPDSAVAQLYRMNSGTPTQVGGNESISLSKPDSGVLEIIHEGDTMTVYWDSVEIASWTDTDGAKITTSGAVGVNGYRASEITLDNFKAWSR